MKSPELSIVIPAHNEAALIGDCLETVMDQLMCLSGIERPEIIVVANGCADATALVATDVLAQYVDIPSTVVDLRESGKKMALNHGLAIARGEMILNIDGDVLVTPGAIQKTHADMYQAGVRVVGGQYSPIVPDQWLNRRPAPSIEMLKFSKRMVTRPHKNVTGRFVGYFRKDLRDGFAPGAAPDDHWLSAYMGTRFGLESIKVSDDVMVKYVPPMTLNDLQGQLNRYRRASILVQKEHPELSKYFDDLRMHWDAVDGEDIHNRWRQQAEQNGLDFDKWVERYEEMVLSAEVLASDKRRLPKKDAWIQQLSTKRLKRPQRALTIAG